MDQMTLSATQIARRVQLMRDRDAVRNSNHEDIKAVREGRWDDVSSFRGMFSEDWPKGIAANLINTAAEDFADNMGPLPTFECRTAAMVSDRAKKFATLRTRVLKYYVQCSNLQKQNYSGVDRYTSYGFSVYIVEPDHKSQMPKIRVDDNYRAHYTLDVFGDKTLFYTRIFKHSLNDLMLLYPEKAAQLSSLKKYKGMPGEADRMIELAYWYDQNQQALVELEKGILLDSVPNAVPGECPVFIAERPKFGECVRGQFDDVIPVQMARSIMQTYALQAVDEIVNAPMVLPNDVQDYGDGPKAIIHTDTPNGVGKVPLNIPAGLFAEIQNLTVEQRVGSRYPEGRSGSIDASIITGQGVEALMGTFSTAIQTGQMILAQVLKRVGNYCFALDEALWPDVRKTITGNDFGTPYEVTYIPSRDIKGDHSCEVSYGLTAGLDPNRALVFLLQAGTAGLISKDTARRQLPVDINVEEEKINLDIEMTRDALTQAIAGYAQAIPMMATQGMDPSNAVQQIAEITRLRLKGESIEEAVSKIFAPPPPPEQASPEETAPTEGGPGGVFDQQTGLPQGIAQGQAGNGAGGARDMIMQIAGTTPSGNPNLSTAVSRRIPA